MLRADITHLDDNAASEFVSGSLNPSAQSKVESHLASCRDCRALVAALAMDAGTDSNAATVPQEPSSPSQVAQVPTRKLTVGDRVGRYLVLSTLGAGGMGVVFSAYDPQLDRKVALKLLRAGITYNTKDARTRLRREAQAIAQLSHPNVVNVYDVGNTDDGDLYIAMEFVEGDTLTTWLKKYPRTWRDIVDVFLQAARGLLAAHSVGLLHRDFKPDNVLVGGDGRVRVTDFGLARSVMTPEDVRPSVGVHAGPSALNVELTATGTVLGTPRYMAPEQLTGPDIDARADQFSFCVALYEALYGTHPLPGATSVSMLERQEKALPPPEASKVPSSIARAVMTGLERDRAKRFPTMGVLISALAPLPVRSPMRYVALGLAGLVLAGAAVAAVYPREPAEPGLPVDGDGKPIDAIGPLVSKINELQEQLNQRDSENRALVAELQLREPDARKIQQLQSEIAQRDDKIARLVHEVAQIKLQRGPAPAKQPEHVSGAFQPAHGDLESCLVEWSLRQSGDAALSFNMTASADGDGHSVEAVPDTAADDRIGPSLRACVTGVLERVRFKPGPDNLDLLVDVGWDAEDRVVMVSARVRAKRRATKTILD